jgi:hypothetical protein
MQTWKKLALGCAGAAACSIGAVSPCYAYGEEPTNNNYSWSDSNVSFWGTMAVIMTANHLSVTFALDDISSSTDIDYFMAVSTPPCGANGKLGKIQIGGTPMSKGADLDLQVFTPNGTYVGGSYSSTINESVDVSAQQANALVAKVYGFNGATDSYYIELTCVM